MKKSTLLIALVMIIGSYACAPKYTCPAYAKKEIKQITPAAQADQKPM